MTSQVTGQVIRATRRFCLLHLAANALLLWLGYEWLGVGESTIMRLVWSALQALAILALFCWLHGATLVYFRPGADPEIKASLHTALRHLLPLVIAAMVVLALYVLLARWAAYSPQPAFKLASWLTLKLRKPVKPATVLRAFHIAVWIARWVLLPLPLLPMASGVAARGWRGFGEFRWRWRGGRAVRSEMPLVPVLLLCGLWLPFLLLGWVPAVGGFAMEMASFVVRIGAAYLLFVAAAVALEFVTSRGRPALSQPKTAASP